MQQDSRSDLTEKSKAFQRNKREFSTTKPALQELLKELLYKGNTIGGKDPHKKKTQNNQENGKIIHTDNYFKCKWIKRTKRHRLAEWMKICACMPSHLPHHST